MNSLETTIDHFLTSYWPFSDDQIREVKQGDYEQVLRKKYGDYIRKQLL